MRHVGQENWNNFINTKTFGSGSTSLHVAAKSGFIEVISLLKHGTTFNVENKEGKTPLNFAKDESIIGLLQLIEELLQYARKGNVELIGKLGTLKRNEFLAVTNARNNQGNTLLQVAITNQHKHIASKLLEIIKSSDQRA